MKTGIRTGLLLALSICFALHTQAQNPEGVATRIDSQPLSTQVSYRGQVSEVTGGNSLIIALDNNKVSIRLLGVSAIKKGHDFSKESRENLARLLRHKTIEVVAKEPPSQGKPESPIRAKFYWTGRMSG